VRLSQGVQSVLLLVLLGGAVIVPVAAAEWFKNSAQQGEKLLEQGDYEGAAERFKDAYRQGVARYRAGQFDEAIAAFTATERPEVRQQASYNLGNAYFQAGQLKEAVTAYENALALDPTDEEAKANLALARSMLEQQKQEQQQESGGQSGEGESNEESGEGSPNRVERSREKRVPLTKVLPGAPRRSRLGSASLTSRRLFPKSRVRAEMKGGRSPLGVRKR